MIRSEQLFRYNCKWTIIKTNQPANIFLQKHVMAQGPENSANAQNDLTSFLPLKNRTDWLEKCLSFPIVLHFSVSLSRCTKTPLQIQVLGKYFKISSAGSKVLIYKKKSTFLLICSCFSGLLFLIIYIVKSPYKILCHAFTYMRNGSLK